MSDKPDLATAIQERLDNSRLTVRLNGKVIGYAMQIEGNKWRACLPPSEPPPDHSTLQDAVEWLVKSISQT